MVVMGQLAVRLGEEWPTSRGEHRKDWKERRVHLEAKGQGPQGAEEGIWVSAFPGHGGWAEKPRELWGEEQPLLVFSDCFSSFRKEEKVSCHQNQEKEASPSTAWHKAHCHITSHYPKPFPSPSPCPPTADSSFLPTFPRKFSGFFSHPPTPPGSCAPPGSRPPRIKNPLPPPLQVSGAGKVFPTAQHPSLHTHRPLGLRCLQAAPEIHPLSTSHHKKGHRGPPTSKMLDSSLSHRPASSTRVSRVPSPTWL